jgi:hypothetical protein
MKKLIRFSTLFLSLSLCLAVLAQAQEFTGTITDESTGEPLFGASVVLTGTAVGATTDFDGKFKFNVGKQPPFNITISYIGYLKQEMDITSLAPLTVKLASDAVMLQGVVIKEQRVTDKQKESALTVESMDILAIKETPAANFYDDPRKFPRLKFSPGDWLSTPSITCNDLTGDVLLNPRVLITLNPILAEVRSTPLRFPRPS